MDKLVINGGKPVSEHRIPIAKPVFSEETMHAISEVLRSGYLCQGPKTALFEEEFRKFVGAEHSYATCSGTAALHVAYMSILNPGEEVIVPDFTFIATASAVSFSNGIPVFADINEDTLTIDVEDVKRKITSKTKAITPVHLFGNASNMRDLKDVAEDHDLYLVNDAAQAHGTKINGKDVGSFDHLNCYSFYPTKAITTGEGGMVTTNDADLCDKGKLIRNHGQESRYKHSILGLNYRMTEISAVIGLNQLKRLNGFLAKRRRNANNLTKAIKRIPGLSPQRVERGANHSYSYYTLIMNLDEFKCSRDEFVRALKAENIDCMVYYPFTLTKQPALRKYVGKTCCPVAEETSKRVFSIPTHPSLTENNLKKIVEALRKVSSYYLK